jgi:hypothetical protein
MLDMKVEAMVPTLLSNLKQKIRATVKKQTSFRRTADIYTAEEQEASVNDSPDLLPLSPPKFKQL